MTGSLFDSALYSGLFATGEIHRLFSDSAAIRAMLLVEGALAKVQGQLGVIPQESASAIHRASLEIQIDPGALATETAQNGVPVPALVAAFQSEMNAPEHAQYVHWGATSQDIMDTGLMLRLRQTLVLFEQDLESILQKLADLAQDHATLPMVARTWGQHATPTSFGAVVAAWGMPLLGLLQELPALRRASLLVSLSGATGTASALGGNAPEQRAALAAALGLNDPRYSWHTDRTPILALSGWMTRCTIALGKLAEDVIAMTQTEISELRLDRTGSSSTMPQKKNPVAASVVAAMALQVGAANGTLHSAATHRFQRDGVAWMTEWALLPQVVLATASALRHGGNMAANMTPDPDHMGKTLTSALGLIHAEALCFALACKMPRPKAQSVTKALCKAAQEQQIDLQVLARADHPELPADLFDAATQMGNAPQDAHEFCARVRALF